MTKKEKGMSNYPCKPGDAFPPAHPVILKPLLNRAYLIPNKRGILTCINLELAYPFVASARTNTFIPHLVGLSFMYCLSLNLPLKGIMAS